MRDLEPVPQSDINVAPARQDDPVAPRDLEYSFRFAGDRHRNFLFIRAGHANRARIDAAMSGIQHDNMAAWACGPPGAGGARSALHNRFPARGLNGFSRPEGCPACFLQIEHKSRGITVFSLQDEVLRYNCRDIRLQHHPAIVTLEQSKPETGYKPRGRSHRVVPRPPAYFGKVNNDTIWFIKREQLVRNRLAEFQHQPRGIRVCADSRTSHFRHRQHRRRAEQHQDTQHCDQAEHHADSIHFIHASQYIGDSRPSLKK